MHAFYNYFLYAVMLDDFPRFLERKECISSFVIGFAYSVDEVPMPEELLVGESQAVVRIIDMDRQCAHAIEFHDLESSCIQILQIFHLEVVAAEIEFRYLFRDGIYDRLELVGYQIRRIIET